MLKSAEKVQKCTNSKKRDHLGMQCKIMKRKAICTMQENVKKRNALDNNVKKCNAMDENVTECNAMEKNEHEHNSMDENKKHCNAIMDENVRLH